MDFSQIIPSMPGLVDGMLMTLKLLRSYIPSSFSTQAQSVTVGTKSGQD